MITTYEFKAEEWNAALRVAGTPELPLFVAQDVCEALGISQVASALRSIPQEEKVLVDVPTPGGQQQVLSVTEAALYLLIFKSRKPEARAFQRWVTAEVLPAIRKNGSYGPMDPDMQESLTAPQWLQMLKLCPVRNTTVCQLLLERVERAAKALRFNTASFRDADGFQRIPVPVLLLAEGIYRRDLEASANGSFRETYPMLPNRFPGTAPGF